MNKAAKRTARLSSHAFIFLGACAAWGLAIVALDVATKPLAAAANPAGLAAVIAAAPHNIALILHG